VKPKPSHARERCTDEKRYPHANLEEHDDIGVAWSRYSEEAFVHCIVSLRAVLVLGAAAGCPSLAPQGVTTILPCICGCKPQE
jgi:hypothetical protein